MADRAPTEDSAVSSTVYIVIPPSPLFAAHWSFFIPDRAPGKGRRIHVSGDRLNGFTLEIIRDYDCSKHRGAQGRTFAIGNVPSQSVLRCAPFPKEHDKDEEDGGGYVDNEPLDRFELVCQEVEAPGPSLNQIVAGSGSRGGKRAMTEVKDCQWWVTKVVEELEKTGMLCPLPTHSGSQIGGPTAMLAALPRH